MRIFSIFILLINFAIAIQPMISWEFNSNFQIRLQIIEGGFWLLFILGYFFLLLIIGILYFTLFSKYINIIQKVVPFIMAFYPLLRLLIIKINNDLVIYFDLSLQIIYSLSILIIFYSIFDIIKNFIVKKITS